MKATLDLDGLIAACYRLKRAREKQPQSDTIELVFPNQKAARQFLSWMGDSKKFMRWFRRTRRQQSKREHFY